MESKVQSKLIKSLEARGAFVLKVSVCNKPGYPDITAFLPDGTVEFYEVKQKGKKPRPLQEYRLKELSRYGKTFVYDGDIHMYTACGHEANQEEQQTSPSEDQF